MSIDDFFFIQKDIIETTQKICTKDVNSARVSQWCNGDHHSGRYNYLRADTVNRTRRLTISGEFDGLNERPNDLINDDRIQINFEDGNVDVTIKELKEWIEVYYNNLNQLRNK